MVGAGSFVAFGGAGWQARRSSPRTRILPPLARILLAAAEVFDGVRFPLVVSRFDATPLPEAWSLSPHHVLVERLLPTGRELHPWTVNRPARILELARLGLPSLTTDDPAQAVATLNEGPTTPTLPRSS